LHEAQRRRLAWFAGKCLRAPGVGLSNTGLPIVMYRQRLPLGLAAHCAARFEPASMRHQPGVSGGKVASIKASYEQALTMLARAELHMAIDEHSAARQLLDAVRALCTPLGAQSALARKDPRVKLRCSVQKTRTSA